MEGNALDQAVIERCLVSPADPRRVVDVIVTSIGCVAVFTAAKVGFEDVHVCEKGMNTLLAALASVRKSGAVGRPRVIAFSSAGLSKFTRDVPLLMLPVYRTLVRIPHKDKRAMEHILCASGEDWVLIRPSHLVDGETDKAIRVGVEDPEKGVESTAIGYTISREDVGKWIFENFLAAQNGEKYTGKAVALTY